MGKVLKGELTVVAKTGGIKLAGSEIWHNPDKALKQKIDGMIDKIQQMKGKQVELILNDAGFYIDIKFMPTDNVDKLEKQIKKYIPDTPEEKVEDFEQKTNRNMRDINPEFIVKIQGKEFITANGLLEIAKQEGGIECITVRGIVYEPEKKYAWATVFIRMKDGREFSDCGSGTQDNLKSAVAKYPLEMAVTRARSRALRFGLNVDYCSADEISD